MRENYQRYVKFRLPWFYPVHCELNAVHWGNAPHTPGGVMHAEAPRSWPWWRLASFMLLRLNIGLPSTGWRLWIYTRWGTCHGDVFFDRRRVFDT